MSVFSIQLLIILHIIFSQYPLATTEQHPISACTCNLFKMPVKNKRQYRLNKKRKRASNIRKVARTRARRIAERQNTETETSNNFSSPAANECDSGTSFNDTSTHSERNGGVPATIEETTTFSLCDSIDKIAPAKKALEFLTKNKGLGMNLKKVNHYEPTPRYNEHFPTCEQKVHMRCVRDSRGIVKYTHRCHDDSGIYDMDQMDRVFLCSNEKGDKT